MLRFHPIGALVPRLGQGKCAKSVILPKDFMATSGASPLPSATPAPAATFTSSKGSTVGAIVVIGLIALGIFALSNVRPLSNPLPDGRAKGMRPSDFDSTELRRGTKHEMEHTTDRKIAERIAMDHLAEDPNYYRKLERMEKAP